MSGTSLDSNTSPRPLGLSGGHVSMPGDPAVRYGGYGVPNFKQRGVRLVMHGGFSRGYSSMIQMAPEQGYGLYSARKKP